MNIADLGEFELIARLTAGLNAGTGSNVGVGDDCAVLNLGTGSLLLATCDSQVEGVHFTFRTSSPEDIGRKALSINLSDIAAMGGEPRYALVSLHLPARLSVDVLDGIYRGLRSVAQQYGTAIVGGNIAGTGKGEQLIIDITLLGLGEQGHILLRSGAHAGDLICTTGTPGDSAAGLDTLLQSIEGISPDALTVVRARHTNPTPRVTEGRILAALGPQVVTAMLDVSDGISGDLAHICEQSGVGALLDLTRLPLSSELCAVAAVRGNDPLYWALHGGEDYELLFTIAPGCEELVRARISNETGTRVTVIGTITERSEGMRVVYPDHHIEPLHVESWDHLKKGEPGH